MNEIEVTSWQQFMKFADGLERVGRIGPEFLFRGQARMGWLLEPTLLRKLGLPRPSTKKAVEIEEIALRDFRSQAHCYEDAGTLPDGNDVMSWWAMMQQHGAPTRLLDWTQSVYVALYFAVISHLDDKGAVWAFPQAALKEARNRDFADGRATDIDWVRERLSDPQPPMALFPLFVGRKSARMITQQSIFTVCTNPLGDHGEIIENSLGKGGDGESFAKLIIPAEKKVEFLRKLRSMNITAKSMFPGLDGMARSVSELVLMALERRPAEKEREAAS